MRKPLAPSAVSQVGAERPSVAAADVVDVLSLVDGFASAHVGSSCVLLWRASVNETRFQLQKEAIEYATNAVPKASILCVIEPASEPPSQELRSQAGRLLDELAPKISCLAYVIEGSGFRAAMIRGVVSSLEHTALLIQSPV